MSDADKRPLDVVPPLTADPVFAAAVDSAIIGDAAAMPNARPNRRMGSDPHDFAGLYIRHRSSFAAHARRFLNDRRDVDEVVQEAFLRLFLALPELETELQALAYCRRTITNLCIDRYRADQRRPRLVDLEALPEDVFSERGEEDPVIRAEDAMVVRQALSLLSPLHQAALVKREIEEKPLPQIAAELQVPEESVKHLLHRARRALRRLLIGTSVEPGADLDEVDILVLIRRRSASGGGRLATVLLLVIGLALTVPRVEDLGLQSASRATDLLQDAFSAPRFVGRPGVDLEEAPRDTAPARPERGATPQDVPRTPGVRSVPQELPTVAPTAAAAPGLAEGAGPLESGDRGAGVGEVVSTAEAAVDVDLPGRGQGARPERETGRPTPAPTSAPVPAPPTGARGGARPAGVVTAEAKPADERAVHRAASSKTVASPKPAATKPASPPAPSRSTPSFGVSGLSGPVRHVGVESHGVSLEPDGSTVARSRFIAIADGGVLELHQAVRMLPSGEIAVDIEPVRGATDTVGPRLVTSLVQSASYNADGSIELTVLATLEHEVGSAPLPGLADGPAAARLLSTGSGEEAVATASPGPVEVVDQAPPAEAVPLPAVTLQLRMVFAPRPAEVLLEHVAISN